MYKNKVNNGVKYQQKWQRQKKKIFNISQMQFANIDRNFSQLLFARLNLKSVFYKLNLFQILWLISESNLSLTQAACLSLSSFVVARQFESRDDVHGLQLLEEKLAGVRDSQGGDVARWFTVVAPARHKPANYWLYWSHKRHHSPGASKSGPPACLRCSCATTLLSC